MPKADSRSALITDAKISESGGSHVMNAGRGERHRRNALAGYRFALNATDAGLHPAAAGSGARANANPVVAHPHRSTAGNSLITIIV
jgi:hypothetical protein